MVECDDISAYDKNAPGKHKKKYSGVYTLNAEQLSRSFPVLPSAKRTLKARNGRPY